VIRAVRAERQWRHLAPVLKLQLHARSDPRGESRKAMETRLMVGLPGMLFLWDASGGTGKAIERGIALSVARLKHVVPLSRGPPLCSHVASRLGCQSLACSFSAWRRGTVSAEVQAVEARPPLKG
jgi:hypothetical protein